jgi:phage repressor protein C with HTH and peptisase S24 domain
MAALPPDQIDPDRFASALRASLAQEHMTQAALARGVGVSQPTVSDWVNGKKTPARDNLERIQAMLGIPDEAIQTASMDEGEHEDVVLVPQVARAEGGDGYINGDTPIVEGRRAYSRSLLRESTGINPERLMAITVVGDSMAPEIPANTPVLYEPDTEITDHGIYVLLYDEGVIIKRVQRMAGNVLRLISTNEEYEDEVLVPVPESDTPNTYRSMQSDLVATLKVLGKIVGYFRAV